MATGENIKKIRQMKKISQKSLSEQTGINISVMNRIENGERPLRADELSKIAKVLNVSTDYIFDMKEKPFRPTITQKDKKDIAKQVEDMLDGLADSTPVSFQLDGNEITDEIREILRASLQNTLEFARLKAKEKYTPKKYRK